MPNISDAALPIFVINLPQAIERRERMIELLGGQGLDFAIIKAVDGAKLDRQQLGFWQSDAQRKRLNPGELGCMLSHRAAWQKIVDDDLPGAIVLEDDLCLAEGFHRVALQLGTAPALGGVGLLRLEADRQPVTIGSIRKGLADGYTIHRLRRKQTLRSGAYALSAAMARQLLAGAHAMRYPVDAELFDKRRSSFGDLRVHQLCPAIAEQAEFDPAIIGSAPFLASTIEQMGTRADVVAKLNRADEGPAMKMLRKFLRPIKAFLLSQGLRLSGWQRRVITGPLA